MEDTCCTAPVNAEKSTLTLSMLDAGSKGTIKDFVMNCEDMGSCRFVRRIKEIGLHQGASFEVLKNTGNGEVSVFCEGATFALGRGMAEKITVELSNGAILSDSVLGKITRIFGIRCRP